MKYDDLVDQSRTVKAPDLDEAKNDYMGSSASRGMTVVLKKVDSRTRHSIRVLQGVYVFMTLQALVCSLVFDDALVRAGFGFLTAAIALDFLSEYLIWRKEHRPAVMEIEKILGELETSV